MVKARGWVCLYDLYCQNRIENTNSCVLRMTKSKRSIADSRRWMPPNAHVAFPRDGGDVDRGICDV